MSLNIDESQRLCQIVKLKSQSTIPGQKLTLCGTARKFGFSKSYIHGLPNKTTESLLSWLPIIRTYLPCQY